MKPTPELIEDLDRAKIRQAEAMHPIDLALAGARLYDLVRDRMAWGVAMEMPGAGPKEIETVVHQRIADIRQEEGG